MQTDKIGNLIFYNADNLEIMRGMKDNEFDLAIVDPPYGIGISSNPVSQRHEKKTGTMRYLHSNILSNYLG